MSLKLSVVLLSVLSFCFFISTASAAVAAAAPHAALITPAPALPTGYPVQTFDRKLEARGFIDWWKSVISKIQPGWASVTAEIGTGVTSVLGNIPAAASSIVAEVEANFKSDGDKIASALLGAFTGIPQAGSNEFESAIADISSLVQHFPMAVSTAVPIALPLARANGQIFKVSEVEVDCFGCAITGNLDIESHFPSLADVADIIGNKKPAGQNPFGLTASLDNFQAHLNLSVNALKSVSANVFTFPLIDSSILSTATLGTVKIGPSFGIDLVLSVEVGAPVSLNWGFDVTLGNVSFTLDALDITKSSARGFEAPQFKTQKFLANHGDTNITISAALHPYVGVSLDVFEEVVGATLDMNVPKLNVQAAQVNAQNDGICHKLGFNMPLLGKVLITPSIEFNVNAGLNLGLAPTKTKLFGMAFTIDPTCTASAPAKVKRDNFVQATQALPWKEGAAVQKHRRNAVAYQTMVPA